MTDIRPVLFVIGLLLAILALGMVLPAIVDLSVGNPDWQVFLASAAATLFAGLALALAFRLPRFRMNLRQAFVLTTLSWVVLTAFAALPFAFSTLGLSFTDAYFEAMSGLTTTGSTVVAGLDTVPPGLLLWRSMLQWLGGVGIIVMAVAVLPMLGIGGMQLFRAESSEKSDKAMPRAAQLAMSIALVYFTLTLAFAVMMWLAGMSQFDAVCHAMTTLATGGYSTRDASIGEFDNAAVDVVVIFGMIAGALPFVLYLKAVRGGVMDLFANSQVRWFLAIVAGATLALTLSAWAEAGLAPLDALRYAAFNAISVITTTGYSTADYGAWGSLAVSLMFFLTFVGGCTGSTAGGIKAFRFQVLHGAVRVQLAHLARPHSVLVPHYDGKPVSLAVTNAVLGFYFAYFAAFAAVSLGLGLHGYDLMTSISGAATAIGNVGPGLGPVIGPAGNFASLDDSAKWLLSAAMLLGRLELFTVLVLFVPSFWRR